MSRDREDETYVDVILDWLPEVVFWLAIVMTFLKTAELFAYFSPKVIFGFTGLEGIYGAFCSLLIEGVIVMLKYRIQRTHTPRIRVASLLVAAVLWLISALVQPLDTFVQTGRTAELPTEILWILNFGIPAVPSVVLAIMIAYSAFLSGQRRDKSQGEPFKPPVQMMKHPQQQSQKQPQQARQPQRLPSMAEFLSDMGADDEEEDENSPIPNSPNVAFPAHRTFPNDGKGSSPTRPPLGGK